MDDMTSVPIKGNWGGGFRTRTAVTDRKYSEKTYLTVYIPATVYQELARRARSHDVPVSALAREVIEQAITGE
jgi:post-segregation antitoxin (ccd killing protein)